MPTWAWSIPQLRYAYDAVRRNEFCTPSLAEEGGALRRSLGASFCLTALIWRRTLSSGAYRGLAYLPDCLTLPAQQ